MGRRALHFRNRKQTAAVNTFIGGVASTIPDAQTLATKLGISENSISNFGVTGSDIECGISVDYNIPEYAFEIDPDITFYRDVEGKVKIINESGFVQCSNLTEVEFPSLQEISKNGLNGCNLNSLDLPELLITRSYSVASNFSLNYVNFPKATRLETNTFRRIDNFECHIPLVTELGETTGNDFVFENGDGITLYCNSYLQTNNNGGEDGDIVYLKGRTGNTIIYV